MDKKLGAILLIAVAVLLISTSSPGSFFSQGQIQSVSGPLAIDGQQQMLVTMLVGSGALGQSGLTAQVSKDQFPNWNTNKSLFIGATKTNDIYTYTLTERTGSTKAANQYVLSMQCVSNDPANANSCLRKYPGVDFNQFKNLCKTVSSGAHVADVNNLAIDTGSIGVPKWSCFDKKARWIIGNFNRVGQVYSPEVVVDAMTYQRGTQPWTDGTSFEKTAQVTLNNGLRTAPLITSNGETIGKATITSLAPLFTTPPSDTGIKAVRSATGTINYQLVDGDVDLYVIEGRSTFIQCMGAAQTGTGGIQTIDFFGLGIGLRESYNDAASVACINQLNGAVEQLPAQNTPVYPWNSPATGVDTSKLNSQNKLSITNNFAIPSVTLQLFASSVGIVTTQVGEPTSISCQSNTNLPAGSGGTFRVAVTGTPNAALPFTASCTPPITVLPSYSPIINTISSGSGIIDVPFTTGSLNGTSTCTVTVKATDLNPAKTKTATCTQTQNTVCPNVPRSGCYLNADCSETCAINPTTCSDGTPIDQCSIITSQQRCIGIGPATVRLISDSSCPVIGGGSGACLPIVQKQVTSTTGGFGITLFGIQLFNFGGTQTSGCETDFVGVIIVIVAALGLVAIIKGGRRR